MKHVLFISVAMAGLLAALAGGAPEDTKVDDAKAVQGVWTPDKGELSGKPMDEAVLKMIQLKMDNGKYELLVGKSPDKGIYAIDATTQPKSITVTGKQGPNKGKTFPAIYELDGDTLRICYDLSGEKRPSEFKSAAGTQLYLGTYSRKKE